MPEKGIISMSLKELDRYELIQKTIKKELKGVVAARLLRLSYRQFKRLKSKVKKGGPKALIHGNRGHKSPHKVSQKEKDKIIRIINENYYDFGPTLATEKLEENHGLCRDRKTITSIMLEEGIWKPKKSRKKSEHRNWRPRKRQLGELLQFDGSYHDWFENGEEHCLLASVDDATGQLRARFAEHEGVLPVFEYWQGYIRQYGKPRAIYTDKFSTYKMNQKVAKENHETLTQFQRAMKQLDIEVIVAHSPEAKGRVEKVFRLLQDRLIKEMRLRGIKTQDEANRYLEKDFLPWFNQRFMVNPVDHGDLHRKISKQEAKHIDSILSRQTERTVNNDFTISFAKQWYQITKQQPVTVCKKDKVTIEERTDGSLQVRLRGRYLNIKPIPFRPKRSPKELWIIAKTKPVVGPQKPPRNHPWRSKIRAEVLINH